MAVTIQVKRGSRATLPVLALGEYGLTTDTKELFIGGPEGVNIQIAVLDNGGQIPEEQLPEMDYEAAGSVARHNQDPAAHPDIRKSMVTARVLVSYNGG